MKPSGKRRALWHVNSRDPDNWLQIPEFGVKPEDVGWQGFALPIEWIMADNRPGARPESVRVIVRSLRQMAGQHFATLKELRACFIEFLDLMEAGARDAVTDRHRVAYVYQNAIWTLEGTWNHSDVSKAADAIADASALVIDWTVNHSIDATLERSKQARESAAKPRVGVSPEDVAAYAAVVGYPTQGKYETFVEDAVAYFGSQGKLVSASTIVRRMREARGKNLMS